MIQIVQKPESKIFNLTLIRHAKSSWKQMGLSDHQRPLTKKGKRDIPIMIDSNISLLNQIDHFYCSSAIRAKSILDAIVKTLSIPTNQIAIDDNFYTFDAQVLISLIKELPSSQQSIAVIGHNPALTELFNRLTQLEMTNLPTTSVVRIRFNMNHWQDILDVPGKLVYFDCPKNYLK